MADITQLIPLTNNLLTAFQNLVFQIQILVGGLAGLYLISIIMNWYRQRQLYSQVKQLNQNISLLNHLLEGAHITKKRK